MKFNLTPPSSNNDSPRLVSGLSSSVPKQEEIQLVTPSLKPEDIDSTKLSNPNLTPSSPLKEVDKLETDLDTYRCVCEEKIEVILGSLLQVLISTDKKYHEVGELRSSVIKVELLPVVLEYQLSGTVTVTSGEVVQAVSFVSFPFLTLVQDIVTEDTATVVLTAELIVEGTTYDIEKTYTLSKGYQPVYLGAFSTLPSQNQLITLSNKKVGPELEYDTGNNNTFFCIAVPVPTQLQKVVDKIAPGILDITRAFNQEPNNFVIKGLPVNLYVMRTGRSYSTPTQHQVTLNNY